MTTDANLGYYTLPNYLPQLMEKKKKSVHDTKKLKEFMSGKTSLSENTGKNSQVG